jgi:hypothetical protein
MPEQTKHGKFEIDPNYDEEADIAKRITEARAYLNNELTIIDGVTDVTLQLICLFAMIDCLAQEQASYPRNSKKAFCDFVLAHQKQCDYLEEVEPITLYYHVEDDIDYVVKISGFPPEKEVTIDDLGYLYGDKVKTVLKKGKAQEILQYIEQKKGADAATKLAQEHQMISLLYRMRSKAVHEMSGLGEVWHNEGKHMMPTEPYYRDVGRGYVQGEELISDNAIELVIPNVFIRNILADCIEGYLEDCKIAKRFPFSHNHMTRKSKLSWYDY